MGPCLTLNPNTSCTLTLAPTSVRGSDLCAVGRGRPDAVHTPAQLVCVLATTTGFTSKKYQYHKSKATRSLKGGLVQTWSQHPAPRPPPPARHQARSQDLCIWTVLPSWVWTMTSLSKYVTPRHSERWIRSNRTVLSCVFNAARCRNPGSIGRRLNEDIKLP